MGKFLPKEVKESLRHLLAQYQAVFAWSTLDITGVPTSLAVHRLNVSPATKPIRQKRRPFPADRAETIRTEVRKLFSAGMIEEIHYPEWLSNPVLVKKPDGSWQMCIDFTDVNKCCPKDNYPLPPVDQLVEAITGYGILAFFHAHGVPNPNGR